MAPRPCPAAARADDALCFGQGRARGADARSPAGSGREGERAARQQPLTHGPGSIVPPVSVLNRIKNISNRFKNFLTLTDPKGVFSCSKNQK
jgi:hypothetical protein